MKRRIFLAILLLVSLYLLANDQLTEKPMQSSIISRSTSNDREIITVFEEDFEDGAEDWEHYDETAPTDWNEAWHLSTTGAYSGNSWWMGDEELGGYTSHRYLVLDTPTLTLSSTPELNCMLIVNCEDVGGDPPYDAWDGANIRISTDGGVTWEILNGTPGYNATSFYSFGYEFNEGAGVPGWGGTNLFHNWAAGNFDLSAYANQEVKIRFAFASDPAYDTNDDPGMFGFRVDNIEIDTVNGLFISDGDGAAGDTQMIPGYGGSVAGDLWHVYEDANAPSPTHAMGCFDDATDTYLPGMSDFIVSPVISLPEEGMITWDVSVITMLDAGTFPDCDYIHVELRSQIPGEDWLAWTSISNPLYDPNGNNYVFTGSIDTWTTFSDGWGLEYADLSMLAGRDVQFRFGLHTNSTDEVVPGGYKLDNFYIQQEFFQGPGPENLTAEVGAGEVNLCWDPIIEGGEEGWLQWDNGVNDDAIGLTGGGTMWAAIRFDAADMMPYTGGDITELEVYINDMPDEMIVHVWNGYLGGNELLSQAFVPTENSWNTIMLDTPVTIEGLTEYWIGYEVTNADTAHSCGTDAGPAIQGKGDFIATSEGSWNELYTYDLDYNWNIHAYVDAGGRRLPLFAGNRETREVTGYNIWRSNESGIDYELIGTVQQSGTPMFTDSSPVSGEWNYYVVTAMYDGIDGEYSNEASAYVMGEDVLELGYDDGTAEIGANAGAVQFMGVKFDPEYHGECVLTHVLFYVETVNTGQYVFRIFDDDGAGGLPGTNYLFQTVVTSAIINQGWNTIEIPEDVLSDVTFSEGSYWVTIFEMANASALGKDTSNPAGHSYMTVGGTWEAVTDGNLMIRSYLYYPQGLGTYGDVDSNGVIDAFDASLVLMNAVGMTTPVDPFPEDLGDVDGNGVVEAYDAALILQYVVGMIDVFPVETRSVETPEATLKAEVIDGILHLIAEGNFYSATIELPCKIRDFQIDESIMYAVNGNKIAIASPRKLIDKIINMPFNYDFRGKQIYAMINGIPQQIPITEHIQPAKINSIYPNPFNPQTTISYVMPQAGIAEIKVYNSKGQLVKTLYNGRQEAGEYKIEWNAQNTASGVYFLKSNLSGKAIEKKMILLK